jgi:hypothetical protein
MTRRYLLDLTSRLRLLRSRSATAQWCRAIVTSRPSLVWPLRIGKERYESRNPSGFARGQARYPKE